MRGTPVDVDALRDRMRAYFAMAEEAPEAHPLTVSAVAKHLGVHRSVLYRHDMNVEVTDEAKRQERERGAASPQEAERRQYSDQLAAMQEKLQEVEDRNRRLLGRIQLAEYNARLEGWDPTKLWRPMPPPDRSTPRTGRRGKS